MNVSASNLVKRSAMQICFFNSNKFKKTNEPSERIIEGTKSQFKKSKSKYVEMCGCVSINGLNIYFSIDEIIKKEDSFILKEHKTYDEDSEDWYLKYSIIQAAFYHSLSLKTKKFNTAKFYQNKGNENNSLTIDKPIKTILEIGSRKFRIKVKDSSSIINYFVEKAKSTTDYKSAKIWDNEHKFNDWSFLKKHIIVKEIE